MTVEQKLQSMGISIPETPKPVAAYIPALQVNDLIFTSGQIPIVKGELKFKGKLGAEISKEQGYQAAKICALNALSAIKGVVVDLDRIEQVVKVVGFVASAEGFTEQPVVINGASEFLQEVLGEKGLHARSAVGVAELPLGVPVEVELIVKVSG
ncbi:RidA family protein [candidate division KSB1 bacterium]|nr:RidA family protein [candidate division KSB1 bacterium]